MAREQHIRVGDTLRLSAIIKGVPFPKVTWKKEDREAPTKAQIDVTPVGSKLEIRNAAHEDGGIYSLTVENPAGTKTVSVKVLVLGTHFNICTTKKLKYIFFLFTYLSFNTFQINLGHLEIWKSVKLGKILVT
jgi:hypothetical protein